MDKKIVFFFGAGAEQGKESFGLPSGSEYTLKTMQQKNSKLYTELRKFYRNRLSDDYAKEYRSKFLFEKGSHTFKEILYRAALECIRDGVTTQDMPQYTDFVDLVREYESLLHYTDKNDDRAKAKRSEIKQSAKDVYDILIKDSVEPETKNTYSVAGITEKKNSRGLKDYLRFNGAVEKDFSTIIDPNTVGLSQFWRVINYFWSAYFTILEPISKQFTWGINHKDNLYQYTLNNLSSVLNRIYNSYDYSIVDQKSGNYYKVISDKYPKSVALTTNYTPFVEHYFSDNVYLAGRLKEFEFPESLTVKDILNESIDENTFLFPFLMTQAPVKPIVVPNQIREYFKALDRLEDASDIIVIGYSLGQADNHINAILRECVIDRNKRIYYCYYTESDMDSDNIEKEKVLKSLKIHDRLPNLYMIPNRGNANELLVKLDNQLIERV